MVRYLSPEWLQEFDAAVSADDELRRRSAELTLVVQHVVTDGNGGRTAYHLTVDRGTVHVRPGEATAPTVSFSQDYTTAAAVARGDLSAQGAFMAGRIRVRGDLPALARHQDAFAGLDHVARSLRGRTEF